VVFRNSVLFFSGIRNLQLSCTTQLIGNMQSIVVPFPAVRINISIQQFSAYSNVWFF
jgi:hypothetical protein